MSSGTGPGIAGILAFGLTVAAMLALRPIAFVIDLVDRPGGHKTHHGVVPVVGGLAMFIGLVFGLGAIPTGLGPLQFFLMSAAALVVVGMLDDRFSLSPWLRLIVQLASVLPMYYGAGVRVEDIGQLFGAGSLPVGAWSLPLTALATVAAINAFNMLDGLDGLAGAMALVALLVLLAVTSDVGQPHSVYGLAALCGAVLGFLVFNLPVQANRPLRSFMGDAGSTLLGFAIAWFSIHTTQKYDTLLSPGVVLWIVAIPAYDLVWTIVRRLSRGASPFRADNEHLHHSLLKAGLGVRAVFVVMLASGIVIAVLGLTAAQMGVSPLAMLVLWAICGVVVVLSYRKATFIVRLFPSHFHRVENDESLTATLHPVQKRARPER